MKESKRLKFLKSYLKIFGVEKIECIHISDSAIRGIAIYEDETDPEDRQEFIWHKSENEVPSPQLNILIEKIVVEKLHNGDKILEQIEEWSLRILITKQKRKYWTNYLKLKSGW